MKPLYILISLLFLICIKTNAQVTNLVNASAPIDFALKENFLYFSEGGGAGKISKIDITNANPTKIEVITGLTLPAGITFKGNELYFADYSTTSKGKISKIDITDANPVITDVITGITGVVNGIAFNENELYIAVNDFSNSGKIFKLNITDPTPTTTQLASTVGAPSGIVISGNNLYFSNLNQGKITKMDITDVNFTTTDIISGLTFPGYLFINENELYIPERIDNKISKMDINEASPTLINVISDSGISGPFGTILVNNELYITEYHGNKISKYNPTLSSNENLLKGSIKLYPNPAIDHIKISGLKKSEKFSIYNILGHKINNGNIDDNENIDIQNLTHGIYFLKFDNANTIKFIKE